MNDIQRRFSFYPPSEDRALEHTRVRVECREFALYLDEVLTDGREKTLALTKLEEVMFWANAAIARQGQEPVE